MAWYDLDLGSLNLGGLDTGKLDLGSLDNFNLSLPSGGEWWKSGDFNLGPLTPEGGWDPQTGWPGQSGAPVDFSEWTPGGPTGPGGRFNWGNFDNAINTVGKLGVIGKTGFDAWMGIERAKQMREYQNKVDQYYKDRKAYEDRFLADYTAAKENFEGAQGEFAGQIEEARGQAGGVLEEMLAAARPLLSQSHELLVPAVAALARGETPAILEPVLNQAKQRATAAAVQSMVSAGMSPEAAQAAAQPMVDQMAQEMLLKQATAMVGQGTTLAQTGMKGLEGAGMMSEVLGKLAAMGLNPAAQEFEATLKALASIIGSNEPPRPPVA